VKVDAPSRGLLAASLPCDILFPDDIDPLSSLLLGS